MSRRDQFVQAMNDYLRGGLPSRSIPDGTRSNETALPALDRADRDHLALYAHYQTLTDPREQARVETIVLGPDPNEPGGQERWTEWRLKQRQAAAEDHQPGSVDCIHCGRLIANTPNDRVKAGRCNACYLWWRAHQYNDAPTHILDRRTR